MPENHYRVTQVDEVTILDEARNPVPGYRVYFTYGDGRTGHVNIVKAQASPDLRDRLIQEEIDRVSALWG